MEFAISEALQDLLLRIQSLLHAEVYPLESAFLNQRFYAIEPQLKQIRRKVQEAGLWAPQAPAELGGLGLPLTDFALVSEV